MNEFATKARDFVKRLQRSDEKTKRRYVYGASAALMIVVVFLWLVYLNVSLPSAAPAAPTSTDAVATPGSAAPAGSSFFGTLGQGFNVVWGDLGRGFQNVGDMVGRTWQDFQNQVQKTNNINFSTSTSE